MNEPVKYRQKAVECYETSRILSDHRQKAKMLAMAQSWISLATLAERNLHLEATTTGLTGHGNGPQRPYRRRAAPNPQK